MGMGRREKQRRQEQLWIAHTELPRTVAHPFYEQLNRVLEGRGFDEFVEQQCSDFYAEKMGRPSLAPGRYFRLLLIGVETHQAVFGWVLELLAEKGLLKGKTVGVDGTTLEANAALRSIVRRDTGEGYQEFLVRLAKESGIATPTREQLANLDRKRAGKGSNEEWVNPHDPEARITKMKDGRTHLAHKAEHAVDLETGAVVV